MSSPSPSRSGAFSSNVDRRMERFSESVSFDRELYRQDITQSIAHAEMLAEVGLIATAERDAIVAGLNQIREEIEQGKFRFELHLEDIHMNIEQALIERLGDVGRRLHTARSRNDQVATDLRLWVRDAIDAIDKEIVELQAAFVRRCDTDADVIIPGYTHLRRAQPVLAAHYWLAYCEKFQRDRERLADCRRRTNINSLGSAALAGTSLPIDREFTAARLNFDGVSSNSLDAVSDRDFLVEFVFALSLVAVHLSGWAEEWILWSSTEFGFIRLPQEFCTGSSIMPQKINPDALELTRGKAARVIGCLQTLLVLLKGLPLAYNRDLQEDKPPAFDAARAVAGCLEIAVPLVSGAVLEREKIAGQLGAGFLDATTLMEKFIQQGVPQRKAHHFVGELVRLASERGVSLAEIGLDEFRKLSPQIDSSVYDGMGAKQAVEAFRSLGSTGRAQVHNQLKLWKSRLGI